MLRLLIYLLLVALIAAPRALASDLTFGQLTAVGSQESPAGFAEFMREKYGIQDPDHATIKIATAVKLVDPTFFNASSTTDLYEGLPVFHGDLVRNLSRKLPNMRVSTLGSLEGRRGIVASAEDDQHLFLWGGNISVIQRSFAGPFFFYPLEDVRLEFRHTGEYLVKLDHPSLDPEHNYSVALGNVDYAKASVVPNGPGKLNIALPVETLNARRKFGESDVFRVTLSARDAGGVPVALTTLAQPIYVERLPERPISMRARLWYAPQKVQAKRERLRSGTPNLATLVDENPEFYAGLYRRRDGSYHRILTPEDMVPTEQVSIVQAPKDSKVLPGSVEIRSFPEHLAKSGWVRIKSVIVSPSGDRAFVRLISHCLGKNGEIQLSAEYLSNGGQPVVIKEVGIRDAPARKFDVSNSIPLGSYRIPVTPVAELELEVVTFDGHQKVWRSKLPSRGTVRLQDANIKVTQDRDGLHLEFGVPDSSGF